MSNQTEAMMQNQIEGAISENEALRQEVERLRGIVAKGRAAYSAYGLLATPPNHDMHTEAGDRLRSEWLRETDDYLHGLTA